MAAIGVAVATLVILGGAAGCSSSGGGGAGGEAAAGPRLPDEVAVDACGNDLSAVTTTVRAVDPATGTVRWTASVPLVDHYLLRSEAGNPQLPLEGRSVEVELELATGEVVAYPPAGAHEVLVDVAGRALSVDGEVQPDAPVVGGLTLSTGYGAVVDGVQRLVATDAGGATAWQLDLGAGGGSVSRPTVYADVVVVTWSPPVPDCGPQG